MRAFEATYDTSQVVSTPKPLRGAVVKSVGFRHTLPVFRSLFHRPCLDDLEHKHSVLSAPVFICKIKAVIAPTHWVVVKIK